MTTAPVADVLSPTNSHFLLNPEEDDNHHSDDPHDIDFDRSDGDTASQRSISLSSPAGSPRQSAHLDTSFPGTHHPEDSGTTPVTLVRQSLVNSNRDSHPYTLDTDFSSEQDVDGDDRSSFMRRLGDTESPISSAAPSLHEKEFKPMHTSALEVEGTEEEEKSIPVLSPPLSSGMSYPPPPVQKPDPRESVASFASGSTTYSKKARPESMLIQQKGPLILGIALVDFNHLVRQFPFLYRMLASSIFR